MQKTHLPLDIVYVITSGDVSSTNNRPKTSSIGFLHFLKDSEVVGASELEKNGT